MKNLFCLILLTFLPLRSLAQSTDTSPNTTKNIAFTNGLWLDGKSFHRKTGYSVAGVLSFRRPSHIDSTLDLSGGYVVPPFGEAHNHNVEPLNKMDQLVRRYLEHGIFYVKDPDNLPRDRERVRREIDRPDSIDVMFSNGGFTGPGGHPGEIVKRNVDRGAWTEADGDGAFYYAVARAEDLEMKWPQFLATKPDFVKTYLLFSEDYAARKDDPKYFGWKGLDPDLLKAIVRKAHAAGLRVSTHVESAIDFHNALTAGVDEINHIPGFRVGDDVKPHAMSEFQIAESDAELAARHGVYVVTTLSDGGKLAPVGKFPERDELNRRNLMLLKKYHVRVALGSDSYRSDTVPEALYMQSLHVFRNRELLEIWCEDTVKTIFPQRRIGKLLEGNEASFLVLKGNPLEDFSAVQRIFVAVKHGYVIPLESTASSAAK
jgi:hypothetical protein